MSKLANLHHPGSEDRFWKYEATSADFYESAGYWACRKSAAEATTRIEERLQFAACLNLRC